jgi:hypothetical protein
VGAVLERVGIGSRRARQVFAGGPNGPKPASPS